MALTLIEAAKLSTDSLQRGVISKFAESSAVLERLPFDDVQGNAYTYNVESSLPGIAFRGVNEAYAESTGVVNPVTESLVIGGGDSDVDKFIVKTRSNVNDIRAVYDAMKAKSLSLAITAAFFDGNSTTNPKSFDGINRRLAGGTQEIEAGGNGASLTQAMLDDLCDRVFGVPDLLLMSKPMRRVLTTLSRTSSQISYDLDSFGRRVMFYNGVGIGIIEEDNAGNEILAFDETQGSSSVTGSIYAVRFGVQQYLWGIQNSTMQVSDLGELDTKPVLRTRIEWYLNPCCIGHPKSVARLKGVLAT